MQNLPSMFHNFLFQSYKFEFYHFRPLRLRLVKYKIFSECKIFSTVKYFWERKIFSSVWLHFKKCFGKYFLVFGCIAENALENPFLSCFSHFLRIQTNIITENQNI